MNRFIQWFIHLVKKDLNGFTENKDEKVNIYEKVKKKINK